MSKLTPEILARLAKKELLDDQTLELLRMRIRQELQEEQQQQERTIEGLNVLSKMRRT